MCPCPYTQRPTVKTCPFVSQITNVFLCTEDGCSSGWCEVSLCVLTGTSRGQLNFSEMITYLRALGRVDRTAMAGVWGFPAYPFQAAHMMYECASVSLSQVQWQCVNANVYKMCLWNSTVDIPLRPVLHTHAQYIHTLYLISFPALLSFTFYVTIYFFLSLSGSPFQCLEREGCVKSQYSIIIICSPMS